MVRFLRRAATTFDNWWKRMPWWLRGIFSASRWYHGIIGLPALGAFVTSLVATGALWIGSLPTVTKILWGAASVVASFGVAGHLGAFLRGRSGNTRLMSDFAIQCLADDLASRIRKHPSPEDITREIRFAYLYGKADPSIALEQLARVKAGATEVTSVWTDMFVLFREGIRRGFLTEGEFSAVWGGGRTPGFLDVAGLLSTIASRASSRTGRVQHLQRHY